MAENSTGQQHGQLARTFKQNGIDLIEICRNISMAAQSTTTPSTSRDGTQPDALLYIIVVLGLYACSMVILMVKYIQRENKEARYDSYFAEFVKREHFDKPGSRNKSLMRHITGNTSWLRKMDEANSDTAKTGSTGVGVPSQKVTTV